MLLLISRRKRLVERFLDKGGSKFDASRELRAKLLSEYQ
jgi:hypothetical protein